MIDSVGDDRRTIKLTKKLAYTHQGESYDVGRFTYDIRAEVSLLSRNIKIIGALFAGLKVAIVPRVKVTVVTRID